VVGEPARLGEHVDGGGRRRPRGSSGWRRTSSAGRSRWPA
jgi:hypothetical protein